MTYYLSNRVSKTAEELLRGFESILPEGLEGLADADGLSGLGIDKLLYDILSGAGCSLGAVMPLFVFLVGCGMLAALGTASGSGTARHVTSAVSAIASFGTLAVLYPAFATALTALRELSAFFGALVPVVSAIPLMVGGTSTGAAAGFGMELALWLMGGVCGTLLPTVVAAMPAASGFGLGGNGAERWFKSAFTRIIGISTAVLAGITALQTFISVCADSATVRIARYAASDMIPVVGSAVSGALTTLAGGLSYAGGIIGAGSVLAILAVALSPLIMLLLYRLALGAANLISGAVGGGVSCISGISDALDALISAYVMTMIIYIFDIITIVIGGVGIIG